MKHDPHTHKGNDGEAFRDFMRDSLEAANAKKQSSSRTPGPAAPAQSGGAPQRQSLLGSPAASRSTDIDPKKKRRSGTLLMP